MNLIQVTSGFGTSKEWSWNKLSVVLEQVTSGFGKNNEWFWNK